MEIIWFLCAIVGIGFLWQFFNFHELLPAAVTGLFLLTVGWILARKRKQSVQFFFFSLGLLFYFFVVEWIRSLYAFPFFQYSIFGFDIPFEIGLEDGSFLMLEDFYILFVGILLVSVFSILKYIRFLKDSAIIRAFVYASILLIASQLFLYTDGGWLSSGFFGFPTGLWVINLFFWIIFSLAFFGVIELFRYVHKKFLLNYLQ